MGAVPRDPEAGLLVRTYAVTHPPSLAIAPRTMTWDQLVYASQGVMTVHAGEGLWVVPPHRAVWVPAGVRHGMEMSGSVAVRALFFAPGRFPGLPQGCCALNVSPLLRALILHTTRLGLLWDHVPSERRLALVILDQLARLDAIPLQLPMPQDPHARAAAARMTEGEGAGRSLEEIAWAVGVSRRTLERRFLAQTGMTLGQWRDQARLLAALKGLAEGRSVTDVALAIGYGSPSAFIAAFKRQLGATPGRYFEGG